MSSKTETHPNSCHVYFPYYLKVTQNQYSLSKLHIMNWHTHIHEQGVLRVCVSQFKTCNLNIVELAVNGEFCL